jgi:general secretion pathway protein D
VKKLTPLLLAGLLLVSPALSSSQSAAPTAPAQPSDQIDLQKYKPGQDFITLNFNDIEIAALIKVMSELTRKNFIIDERVKGKVTLMTPTRISPIEAYQVFLSALEIKGFTAVEDGKVVRIIPTAAARQSGLKVVPDGDMRGEGFVTKLIRMAYVNPQDISRTLTPLMSKDGNLIAYPATNSLIVTDSVHNIRKIESLIRALDVPAPEGKGKINVYPLRHANAEDIAKVMSSLVSRLPVPPAGGAQQLAGPSTILEGAVTITSDKATNSLIIVASPIDYETVKDVLKKLDIRRRQVYVEAAIIEMGLSKSRELGFEFQAMSGIDNSKITAVGGTNFGGIVPATVQGPAAFANFNGLAVGAVKGTFTYNGTEFLNIGALLRALQTDGDVNVLSTPNILTTDNQKAEIMVGENVPFKTGQSQSAATGGASILTTIERKDVGINLKITPQITSDDSVRLELYQEISNVVESATSSVDGPTTSKRSASTTVVIKDRETMVIGGLIRDNVTSTASKVPLLGDIPILGWLFKYKTTKVEKTNLMIFITPYIIKNEQDAADITRMKNESQEDFRKDQRFEKKGVEPVPAPPAEKAKTDGSGADAAVPPVSNALPSEKPSAPAEGAQ